MMEGGEHGDKGYKIWVDEVTTGTLLQYSQVPLMENTTQPSTTDEISPLEEYSKTFVKNLWLVFPPVVVAVGTIGNILCFLVTRRRSFRRSSVGLCLSVLSLADLMVLYTGVTRNWSKEQFKWDIRDVHESLCKIHRILLYFSIDYSAWVLVTVTVERFISVCYPFKAVRLCTLKSTRRILIAVAIFICVENIGVLFVKGRQNKTQGNATFIDECGYTSEVGEFYWKNVRPWCIISLYAVIPFAIMIVCGCRIIVRLYRAKKATKRMENFKHDKNHHKLLAPHINHVTDNVISQSHQMNLASIKMHSVTVMTVVIACVFLLLSTPSHLEFFLEKYWDKTNVHDYVSFRLTEACSRMLLYTYHSIPFYVYMASGKQFRDEFVSMIKMEKSNYGYTLNTRASTKSSPAVIRRASISTLTGTSPALSRNNINVLTSRL